MKWCTDADNHWIICKLNHQPRVPKTMEIKFQIKAAGLLCQDGVKVIGVRQFFSLIQNSHYTYIFILLLFLTSPSTSSVSHILSCSTAHTIINNKIQLIWAYFSLASFISFFHLFIDDCHPGGKLSFCGWEYSWTLTKGLLFGHNVIASVGIIICSQRAIQPSSVKVSSSESVKNPSKHHSW